MIKKKYFWKETVKGKDKTWCFNFYADPKYIQERREDGSIIDEIVNTIPTWAADMGLVRPWCFLQDIFNFKNPFKR